MRNQSGTVPMLVGLNNAPLRTDHVVLAAVESAGSYTQIIHGYNQLSLNSGLVVQDMVSHGGVSFRKLPLVLHLALTLFFGSTIAGSPLTRQLVQSSDTYAIAAERSAQATSLANQRMFVSPVYDNLQQQPRVLSCHLQIDDSNKGVDLSTVQGTMLFNDGTVHNRGITCNSCN